jgi:hypothetical protein
VKQFGASAVEKPRELFLAEKELFISKTVIFARCQPERISNRI